MTIRITVDQELCIGSGDCERIVPAAFRIDHALGVSVPLAGAGDQDPVLLERAALACPTQSIRLVAADGMVLHESNG
jgi:ferredoxin